MGGLKTLMPKGLLLTGQTHLSSYESNANIIQRELLAEIGTAESVKSVATIYAPISGKVLEMNSAIDADKGRPQLINRDPLGKGWILKMKATGQ